MSLTGILRIGGSGLKTAQSGLRAVSDNISNVNTPGYVRKVVEQSTVVIGSAGQGVEVSTVRRSADLYLQRATVDASGEMGRAQTISGFLDRAQSLFGDPSDRTSFFSRMDDVFSAVTLASSDPTSNLRRSAVLTEVKRFFDDSEQISHSLDSLSAESETRLSAAVDQANGLIKEIDRLNVEISKSVITGRDVTGAENAQSQLIDELAKLMDLSITRKTFGGVSLRAGNGASLVGETASQLVYDRVGGHGLSVQPADGGALQPLSTGLEGGEIRGLVDLQERLIPNLADQLGEYATRAADALNKVHNAATAVPAPAEMKGRATGLDLPTAIAGFTGRTSITVMDAGNTEERRIDIDFDKIAAGAAGGFVVDGTPTTAFGPSDFLTRLNTALGSGRTATFGTGGTLNLSTTNTGEGFAIVDDPAAPSDRGGRGFSHYFGLNDLVTTDRYSFYETGLRPTDPHGFTPGQTITFRLTNEAGGREQDVAVTVPPSASGTDMQTLLGELNSAGGMGRYGRFTLDDRGAVTFTSDAQLPVSLTVLNDNTVRAGPSASMSDLFGFGSARRSSRAEGYSVKSEIAAKASRMAFAQLDFGAALGTRKLETGDNRGALALSNADGLDMRFQTAGDMGPVVMSIARYAQEFGGVVGRAALDAQDRAESAAVVAAEAGSRRTSVEGVNLDDELIQLTTYQQAYNASARLIQAATEMYDVLINLI